MKFLDKFIYGKKIKKAKAVERVPSGCVFLYDRKNLEYQSGDLVICPTKMGRKALFEAEIWTPHDPGDQHFYRWHKLCYVD